ncbi:unnamed protein product [Rotaria sordida]|uniref:Uncharacterized protein n=1 Tax=Rotaria sordida TaxID=392033 RepID=A0A818I321_9BILA|nr:unnamed protein product [Rotaria sordida]CAF0901470.1 unnamed protein product [Rotaria sordida]CAF3518183.1 unnamed protein product [Rotaria sordida]
MSEYCNNCFCCGCYLVPRYKRLVNNVFPANPQHGLDKNNLERLRFYAVLKPEKLDKSFRYMSEKVARYLRHRNKPYVILGIKAMNDTMKSCYQQLNTFVDHYLDALRLVLEEKNDLELTEHAVSSFESFCEIREEAPNYQRNYEFFVDRFTELCHNNSDNNKTKFRCLGLRGHHALIRKTANDELQNDVWKHMDKIVPSIVFNMEVRDQDRQSNRITSTSSQDNLGVTTAPEQIELIERGSNTTNDNPAILAEIVLRDLFCRAHLNNITACVQPILIHLDNHAKWIPVDFPKYIFSEIMNSIKHHNSYLIIELLLGHLEKHFHQQDTANIKTSIMNVIQDCMVFAAANTGAGSTMFTGILRLLKFLRKSFQIQCSSNGNSLTNNQDEHEFQTAVINGIGNFAEKLPDFQMMEIMQFIITSLATLNQGYEETTNDSKDATLKLQLLLLKTVKKVAATYQTVHRRETSTQTTFPHQLFDPLLKMLSAPEPEVRLIVLEILQPLVDRRQYADKLHKIKLPKDISQLELPTETKANRLFDIAFMKKFGRQFLSQLYQCILMDNNTKDIYHAIYCLMNLVTLEAVDKDVLVDVIHFCFEIQSKITKMSDSNGNLHQSSQRKLSRINHNSIHALIAAYFNLMSKLNGIRAFSHHVDDIKESY